MKKTTIIKWICLAVFSISTLIQLVLNIGISQFRIANIILASIMLVSILLFGIIRKMNEDR